MGAFSARQQLFVFPVIKRQKDGKSTVLWNAVNESSHVWIWVQF